MKKKWFFENLRQEALKYKTKAEFKKGNPAAQSAASKRKDYGLICCHMPKHVNQSGENNPFFKWTFEKLKKEALKYTKRKEFEIGNPAAYQASHKRSDYEKIVIHMDPSQTKPYTDQELKTIALKYTNIIDFQKYDYGAYQAAHKKGKDFWCEISIHIQLLKRNSYTDDEIIAEARKYEERTKFAHNSPSVYNAARKKGKEFLDKSCFHMKRPKISSPEKMILEEILKFFPNAKKFRATRLNIPNKPYIKILEVDILVPELGKAIEYDGGWHHSFEGLKRGHPTWLEKDLRQYHEIKDLAFLSLGIQIFHIKEEDWIKDKQVCIDKCLIFLGLVPTRT